MGKLLWNLNNLSLSNYFFNIKRNKEGLLGRFHAEKSLLTQQWRSRSIASAVFSPSHLWGAKFWWHYSYVIYWLTRGQWLNQTPKMVPTTRLCGSNNCSRNAFESVLMRWMNPEPIIQSEVSQKEDKCRILMHIHGIERDDTDDPTCRAEKETQM